MVQGLSHPLQDSRKASTDPSVLSLDPLPTSDPPSHAQVMSGDVDSDIEVGGGDK